MIKALEEELKLMERSYDQRDYAHWYEEEYEGIPMDQKTINAMTVWLDTIDSLKMRIKWLKSTLPVVGELAVVKNLPVLAGASETRAGYGFAKVISSYL